MSDKTVKKRVVVNLTTPYIEALDHLVNEGIYMERQVVIRSALRVFFRLNKIEPFYLESVEEDKEN